MPKIQAESRIQTICLLILTGLALAAAMFYFRTVLVPFVLAVFFSYALTPLIDLQIKRIGVPRKIAILSTAFLAVLILIVLGLIVSVFVSGVANDAENYATQLENAMQQVFGRFNVNRFGVSQDETIDKITSLAGESARTFLTAMVNQVMSIISNGILVLIFTIFLLLGRGSSSKDQPSSIMDEIEAKAKTYIISMILISSATGIVVGSILTVLGVPYAWMFAFLAFLLNFIPSIGSIIATLLPLPVVLLDPEMLPLVKAAAIIIPGSIQFCVGNIVQPKVLGDSLDLHPVTVLLSLIFFGLLWGIVGMFLATPIAAILRMLFDRSEYTRPVAAVMAGHLDWISKDPPVTNSAASVESS